MPFFLIFSRAELLGGRDAADARSAIEKFMSSEEGRGVRRAHLSAQQILGWRCVACGQTHPLEGDCPQMKDGDGIDLLRRFAGGAE
jgi:hypothetical protein